MNDLLSTLSQTYQLDSKWMKAIVTTESQWNLYAVRYEVSYSYLYQPERFAKSSLITLSTEIATQKISWGLCQVMGALAREQGHEGFMPELLQPQLNLKHLCIRLAHLKTISSEMTDVFAMYNGGPGALKRTHGVYSNQSYVDKVTQNLLKFC